MGRLFLFFLVVCVWGASFVSCSFSMLRVFCVLGSSLGCVFGFFFRLVRILAPAIRSAWHAFILCLVGFFLFFVFFCFAFCYRMLWLSLRFLGFCYFCLVFVFLFSWVFGWFFSFVVVVFFLFVFGCDIEYLFLYVLVVLSVRLSLLFGC